MKWLYWDDPYDNMSDDLSGTNIVTKKKNRMKISAKEKLTTPKTRVQKLYGDFKSLSQIEKENFVNMIRNFVVHGHL